MRSKWLLSLLLAGCFALGCKIALEPGSVILAEDLTGKGHISHTIGTEDRIALNIQLPDQ